MRHAVQQDRSCDPATWFARMSAADPPWRHGAGVMLARRLHAAGLIGLLAWLLVARAWASDAGPLPLQSPDVSWLRDPGGRLTIAQVAAHAHGFEPLRGGLSEGFTYDVVWLKVVLPAAAQGGERWLEIWPGALDDVRLYQAAANGAWVERRSGNALPFEARDGPDGSNRNLAFRLAQPQPGDVLYLRIRTTGTMVVALRLWHGSELRAASAAANIGYGMHLGFVATAVLFYLAGWLLTRRALYGAFSLLVAVATLRWFAADGLASQFLFPHDATVPLLATKALVGLQWACASLFVICLLQLRERAPYLLGYYRGLMLMGLAVALSSSSDHYGTAVCTLYIGVLLGQLLSIPLYLRLWRTGGASGRLVAASLSLYCLIILPGCLGAFGLLPLSLVTMQSAHLLDLPLMLTLHLTIVLRVREAESGRKREREQACEAMASSLRERRAFEEQSRLLAMMTHEVRTPVAVIDAAAYSLRLLDDIGGDRAQRESRYQSIQLAVRRLKLLMELAEARERLVPGEQQLDTAPFGFADLSREVLASLEPQAAARVSLEAGAGLPQLDGDVRLLHFALLNLLDNALKYAYPASRILIDIAAGMREGVRGVAWRIRDQGPGVPLGKEDVIFEKFRRLGEIADQPGLGLGLPLARKIMELHGGTLCCDPGWREGACFVAWLPEAA
ncbi:sensor histidine kinase [Cupriavidus sp. UME77]|uniref:sensor histidine kinase n=1 Tax=Cupriavidus sp. UME77 TaxID=1862321 RepID=UPI002104BC69|nr:sensor histidine kinase [Cupriavidus sp. UME77]